MRIKALVFAAMASALCSTAHAQQVISPGTYYAETMGGYKYTFIVTSVTPDGQLHGIRRIVTPVSDVTKPFDTEPGPDGLPFYGKLQFGIGFIGIRACGQTICSRINVDVIFRIYGSLNFHQDVVWQRIS